jgi:hypothetical protein
MQGLWAQLRAALAQPIYSDCDIVNCTPALAKHAASSLKPHVRTLFLDEYVDNREAKLADLQTKLGSDCTRADAKRAVIAVIFGCKAWQQSNAQDGGVTWLAGLSDEMRCLNERVPWVGDADKETFTHTKLAHYIFTLEYDVLMAAKEHLEQQDWSCDALIHDGFLIRHLGDCSRRPTEEDLAPLTAVCSACLTQTGTPLLRAAHEVAVLFLLHNLRTSRRRQGCVMHAHPG